MARLRVRLRGKPVYDITLAEDRSYVAGRKEDCDIVLQPEKGISREHFKISFVEGAWQIEVVSRYGEVIHNGEQIQQLTLSHGVVFSLPPYEFDYLNTTDEVPKVDSSNLPALTGVHESEDFNGSEEKTVIGVAPLAAYIKIVDTENETQEMIRLDAGDSWVAGRESTCHIHIRDLRVSRRQFEIRRAGSQYVIIDLGSVNGTLVNGSPISSTEPTPIRSGDAISVLTNYLYFELHDAQFQNRLDAVDVPPLNPLVPVTEMSPAEYQQASPHEIMPYHNSAGMPVPYQQPMAYPPGPVAPPTPSEKPKFDFQKNRPKLIIGAVALLLIAYLFAGDSDKPPAPTAGMPIPGSPMDAFNKLKPEQQALVRQRYKDAKNLYMQGKYQLAQDEIIKITELVPDYEDIKEIERLSKEAIFIQDQQRRQEQLEKAKIETEERIQKQTTVCQKLIQPEVTMAQMDECLSSILQFNPEHPRILELRHKVEELTARREAKAAERMAYNTQISKLRGMYSRAQDIQKRGKPLDAIAAYEKVAESSLPDPGGLKSQSKRTIAAIRQQMNSKTATFQAEAEKFYQAQNLKGAILALRKARAMDPTNPLLPEKIEQYTVELRKQMMTIYQEGILEESFGNVEGGESKAGAKDKWKKILELDVPDGEYYKKAFIKLKKYGAL